jgi:hypothetical protein
MIRRNIFLLSALLALSACAQPAATGYNPEVSDADREFAGNSLWGADAECIGEAASKGVPRDRAALVCACVKGVMTSKITKPTVDFIVTRRPQTGDPMPEFVRTDADFALSEGLRICAK